MTKREKQLERIRHNPKNVRFVELESVLLKSGFVRRQRGSHVVFSRDRYRITVPVKKPFVKSTYVKQMLEILDSMDD